MTPQNVCCEMALYESLFAVRYGGLVIDSHSGVGDQGDGYGHAFVVLLVGTRRVPTEEWRYEDTGDQKLVAIGILFCSIPDHSAALTPYYTRHWLLFIIITSLRAPGAIISVGIYTKMVIGLPRHCYQLIHGHVGHGIASRLAFVIAGHAERRPTAAITVEHIIATA